MTHSGAFQFMHMLNLDNQKFESCYSTDQKWDLVTQSTYLLHMLGVTLMSEMGMPDEAEQVIAEYEFQFGVPT